MERNKYIYLSILALGLCGVLSESLDEGLLLHDQSQRSGLRRKLKSIQEPDKGTKVGEHLYHRIALQEPENDDPQITSEIGIGPTCMCTRSMDNVHSIEEATLLKHVIQREDRCLPGLCAEEKLYKRPLTPVCPNDIAAWKSPIQWENLTTIDKYEDFTLDSGTLMPILKHAFMKAGHSQHRKIYGFLAGFYRLISYKLWPKEGVTVIENSTTATDYMGSFCESVRRKLNTDEAWYPCFRECNVELCKKEVASTGLGDDGQFCAGDVCPTSNYYCGFGWMLCGARVRILEPVSAAFTRNSFITRNGHIINCKARMLMPNACYQYEDILTQTVPSSEIDYVYVHQNKRYDKAITLAQNIFGVYETVVQIMPRLMSVWEYFQSDPSIKIHLGNPVGVQPMMEGYFEALGISTDRIVYGDIFADIAIAADTSCGAVRNTNYGILLDKLRNVLRANIALQRPWVTTARTSLVIVKREGRREVRNHEDMVAAISSRMEDKSSILGKCNYELDVYEPGVSPWVKDFRKIGTRPLDIFARFYNAAVVVGPHGGGFSNIIVSKPGTKLLDFMLNVPTDQEYEEDPNLRRDPAILSFAFAEIARATGQHHIALVPKFVRPNKFTDHRLDDNQESHYLVDPQKIVRSIEEAILQFGCGHKE